MKAWTSHILTTNNGTIWTAENTGLTTTNVHSITVKDSNIFVGIYGNAVFASGGVGTGFSDGMGGYNKGSNGNGGKGGSGGDGFKGGKQGIGGVSPPETTLSYHAKDGSDGTGGVSHGLTGTYLLVKI